MTPTGVRRAIASDRIGVARTLSRAFWHDPFIERHHIAQSHWYLMTLGTDPQSQGHGLGKALVRNGLDRCDADGVPAYLESGDANNIGFYEGLGFRLLGGIRVSGGPTFYPMVREPIAGD